VPALFPLVAPINRAIRASVETPTAILAFFIIPPAWDMAFRTAQNPRSALPASRKNAAMREVAKGFRPDPIRRMSPFIVI